MSQRRTFGAIRKLPSGRYQASHAHPGTGARVNAPRTFPSRAEAAKWLKAVDVDLSRGAWTPPKAKTAPVLFGAYATQWLDRRKAELKPKTHADYTRQMPALAATFGTMPLDQIDTAAVRGWYATLDPATPAARAKAYVLLKSVMKTAVEDELIPVNPCTIRGAGSRGKRAHNVTPATPDQIRAIAAAMPARWSLMVLLGVWCGLRFGEIAELRRGDVDLPDNVIRVRRGVQWVNGQPVVSTPKTDAGVRTVALPDAVAAVMGMHLDVYAGPELLFTAAHDDTRHLSHGTFSKAWARAREAAGRPDLRFHDLRHTGASLMAENGASVRELQDWLGHTTAEQSLFYSHVSAERRRANAARLSELAA